MKWCVSFPEEDLLIKRPCLRKACGGNKAAAAFLSYLLYQVSISQQYKKNADNINQRKAACGETPDQEISFNVYRRQQEIVEEMDEAISDRTLRDTAIPLLVALGYIEVDDTNNLCYPLVRSRSRSAPTPHLLDPSVQYRPATSRSVQRLNCQIYCLREALSP